MVRKHVVPIIILLALAAALYAVDPLRRAGPGLTPASMEQMLSEPPASLGLWQLGGHQDALPRAFQSFHEVSEQSVRYVQGNETAYLRVAIARDRRDLRAYAPAHAMRRAGWSALPPVEQHGLELCIHQREMGLLAERISIESAYVLPGRWGHQAKAIDRAPPLGPGWPGPGAVVQLVLTNPEAPANELRQHVRDLAEELASSLQGDQAP